jgi:hypothetical protein
LKKELLNENNNVKNVLKKYFKFTDKIKTTNNISYTNNNCNKVSNVVRTNLNKVDDYEVNEYLVCRKYLKTKNHTFNVNFKYKIIKIDNNTISIVDESIPNKIHTEKIEVINNHFIHAYCRTCHSYQGSSIKDEITIFEWYLPMTSRKWIWTAITRTTDLNKGYIYDGKVESEDVKLINNYFNNKIENYKKQDLKARRNIGNNYVNVEWLNSCLGKACNCGEIFEITNNKNVISSNITANRIDNELSHTIDNIIPMCVICNVCLSNK